MEKENVNKKDLSGSQDGTVSRRSFLTQSALAGAGLALGTFSLASAHDETNKNDHKQNNEEPKPLV